MKREFLVAQALVLSLALTPQTRAHPGHAQAQPGPARAQARQYTLTNVDSVTNVGGAPQGSAVGVAGLSDTGFVTSWVINFSGPLGSTGFRWSPRGTLVPEAPAGVVWLGFNAVDVNDAGTFIGSYGDLAPSTLLRGYRWKAGVTEELLTPLGLRAFPTAINDEGWIIGYAGVEPVDTPGAVVWSPDLVPRFVADLKRVNDINKHGQIVGFSLDANDVAMGYLYEQGRLIPLGSLDPLGHGSVIPRAINDRGQVVGISMVNGREHAFLWTAATGMTELPDLGIQHFPFNVAALDIDDSGVIIGYAPNENGQTSVLWGPDGSVVELDPLCPDVGLDKNWAGWVTALRINAAGQIAGFSPHKPSDYQARTVLLTPAALRATALLPGTAGSTSRLEVSGAMPGKPVFLAVAVDDPFDRGYTIIPTCAPMGLSMAAPHVIAVSEADVAGQASFQWNVPAGLFLTDVRLQAFQPDGCSVSNVVRASL